MGHWLIANVLVPTRKHFDAKADFFFGKEVIIAHVLVHITKYFDVNAGFLGHLLGVVPSTK